MLANWPILGIRIAESMLVIVIVLASVVAAVVPLLVSIGFSLKQLPTADDAAAMFANALVSHWLVFVYIFLLASAVLVLLVALHSFVEAGSAQIYVDAERKTIRMPLPSRSDLRAFTVDRWMQGARECWWAVFWIYNIAWTVASAIALIPLVALLAVILALRENAAAAAITGCVGLLVAVLFLIPVGVVTSIWTQKAIVVAVARTAGAMAALSAAWREFRQDAGRHVAVAIVLIIVMMAGSLLFASMSAVGRYDTHAPAAFTILMLPLQFSASIANGIFSAAIGAWMLAAFAALAVEPRP